MTILSPAAAKIGRPTALTAITQEIICKAISQGMYIERACALADIDKGTYYDWLAKAAKGEEPYIHFLHAAQKAEAEHQSRNLALIAEAAQVPHYWSAAAWQLERRYQREYALQPVDPVARAPIIQVKIIVQDTRKASRVIEGKAIRELPAPIEDSDNTVYVHSDNPI